MTREEMENSKKLDIDDKEKKEKKATKTKFQERLNAEIAEKETCWGFYQQDAQFYGGRI